MDAQEQHDEAALAARRKRPCSRRTLEAAIRRAEGAQTCSLREDSIRWALERFPGLTREEAEEMIKNFGG